MVAISHDTKIQYLKGVGPKIGAKLNKLGIFVVRDLLYYFPRRYEDYTQISKIGDLQIPNSKSQITNKFQNLNYQKDETRTIRARVIGIANKITKKRGFTITEAVVADGSGSIKIVWFNQPYLVKMLPVGSEVILNGKISYDFITRRIIMESPTRADKPKIVPVYGETVGLSSYLISRQIARLRQNFGGQVNLKEFLPERIIKQNQLLDINQAVLNIHQPENRAMLNRATERLKFDELFLLSLRALLSRVETEKKIAPNIKIEEKLLKKFTSNLPFELTEDQKISAWRIICDLQKSSPMNRMLCGDVGSGKTVVATFASFVAILAGYRVVMMAPTEILAEQHYKTCTGILSKFGISIGLITANSYRVSGMGYNDKIKDQKPDTKYLIHNTKNLKLVEKTDLIIGTHALLQDKILFKNIGLVIVDEQHKFGVKQRQKLTQLFIGNDQTKKLSPHFLSMTATPIPRTLYLALFSDLDLSTIKTMPAGRKNIDTKVVNESNRERSYKFIRNEIEKGRQAFVVCPLIEIKTDGKGLLDNKITGQELFEQERKSVVAEYEKLDKKIFPDLKIGMLHGKMKSKEKEAVMTNFKNKKLDILVSTSVVEVGIDVPNATIMMIEDAERFGLATLHQFRGRVGRSKYQSYCFLFSSTKNPVAVNRLRAMEQTNDGFKLAEIDLKNRGAGDMFGTLQSGEVNLKIASFSDNILIEKANESAKEIIVDGIDKYPALIEKIKQIESTRHME